jgi:hypothetical protein
VSDIVARNQISASEFIANFSGYKFVHECPSSSFSNQKFLEITIVSN